MRANEYIAAMTLWPVLLAIVLSYPHMVQGASTDDHHDTLTKKLQTGNYSRASYRSIVVLTYKSNYEIKDPVGSGESNRPGNLAGDLSSLFQA